jgi:hypothetical protein
MKWCAGGKEMERRRWAAGFWAKREGVNGLGFFPDLFETFSNFKLPNLNSFQNLNTSSFFSKLFRSF